MSTTPEDQNSSQENSSPEAKRIWDSLQKEMIPYLLETLPDELFVEGRESELFVALNKELYAKYLADGAVIPRDIQFDKQLNICGLMPAFRGMKNKPDLLRGIFEPEQAKSPLIATSPFSHLRPSAKIVTLAEVNSYRETLRTRRRKVVATNGCFDLLHVGHLRYLSGARGLGDFLWVGLNGDASVHELKGAGRPIVPEADRAELLAAWRVVDAVTIFPSVRATDFLRAVQPDIYVKGGDYTVESLNAEEAAVLKECGAQIVFAPLVQGKSTTNIVKKLGEGKN